MLQTKKSKVIELMNAGDYRAALRIASKFNIEFDKEQQRVISIGYECLSGHESFYKQLNIDTELMKSKAIEIVKTKYNIN